MWLTREFAYDKQHFKTIARITNDNIITRHIIILEILYNFEIFILIILPILYTLDVYHHLFDNVFHEIQHTK